MNVLSSGKLQYFEDGNFSQVTEMPKLGQYLLLKTRHVRRLSSSCMLQLHSHYKWVRAWQKQQNDAGKTQISLGIHQVSSVFAVCAVGS